MASKLFENFNTTNETNPYFEPHLNFAQPILPDTCSKIGTLPAKERCRYAKSEVCSQQNYIFAYTTFFFCVFDSNDLSRYVGFGLLTGICILQFWVVVVTANQFFVPAITEVSKVLKMNEFVAGVTILALGNGVSDYVISLVGIEGETRQIYTDCITESLFGCVFMSSFVIWVCPFANEPYYFLRDVGFVLFYVQYVDYCMEVNVGNVSILMALSIVCVYLIYIVVVIVDQYLLVRQKNDLRSRMMSRESTDDSNTQVSHFEKRNFSFAHYKSMWDITLNYEYQSPNKKLWKQLFAVLDTLDRDAFSKSSHILKMWALAKVIPLIALRLLIPPVNLKERWSKLLCSLQCVIIPSVITFGFTSWEVRIFGIPVVAVVFILCIPVALWAFRHSRTDAIPSWYKYMIFLNILSSTFVLYVTVREIVATVETLGLALHRSNSFVGSTFFTWGTGIVDLLTNMEMSRKGFPRMAFSACIGATSLSICASIGAPLLYKSIVSKTGSSETTEGSIGKNCTIILIVFLVVFIIYGVTTNFMMRRTAAIMGMTLYGLFVVFAVASEFDLLHAWGTDHSLERNRFQENYFD